MENEIVQSEFNALFSPAEIQKLIVFEQLSAEVKTLKKEKEKSLIEFCKKYGIKSFENDDVKITYVLPTKRKSVDTEKLKKEGLYELYLKESNVDESIRINIKYE